MLGDGECISVGFWYRVWLIERWRGALAEAFLCRALKKDDWTMKKCLAEAFFEWSEEHVHKHIITDIDACRKTMQRAERVSCKPWEQLWTYQTTGADRAEKVFWKPWEHFRTHAKKDAENAEKLSLRSWEQLYTHQNNLAEVTEKVSWKPWEQFSTYKENDTDWAEKISWKPWEQLSTHQESVADRA